MKCVCGETNGVKWTACYPEYTSDPGKVNVWFKRKPDDSFKNILKIEKARQEASLLDELNHRIALLEE